MLIDQVCLSLKMVNWRLMFGLMLPGSMRSMPRVRPMVSSITPHMFSTPRPVGAGR